ncbi:MAG: nucleotidyltransferase domain-containing protein [Thermotogota bacterium]
MISNELKESIIENLKSIEPKKIIIFGSFCNGCETPDSDLDIYVVTNQDFIPKNFREKKEIYLNVSQKIRKLRQLYPIDLIVHTKKMYEEAYKKGNAFIDEINRTGIVIYG